MKKFKVEKVEDDYILSEFGDEGCVECKELGYLCEKCEDELLDEDED